MRADVSRACRLISVGVLLLIAAAPRAQQARQAEPAERPRAAGKPWVAPRTPDGQPDLQGGWGRIGISQVSLEQGPGERGEPEGAPPAWSGGRPYSTAFSADAEVGQGPVAIRPNLLSENRHRRTGIIDPPDGKIPIQPWAEVRRRQTWARMYDRPTLEHVDPHNLCMPPGVPRSGAGGYYFVQSPGAVELIQEFNHVARVIRLDGRPHIGANIQLFMGDSRGRWEGPTLVVDTTNFTGKTWLDYHQFHSNALRAVERFTLAEPDIIDYQITFEDPKVFTRPWTVAGYFYRAERTYEPYEYACWEGNRTLDDLLAPPGRR